MKLQQVLSYVRKAIDDYHMIDDGDRIAIGISGGKDSLTLLYALHGLKRFYPKHFDIHAVTVDLGFDNLNLQKIIELCKNLDVEYTIVKTDIAQIVFEQRKEEIQKYRIKCENIRYIFFKNIFNIRSSIINILYYAIS